MAYNPRGNHKRENESTGPGPASYASIINLHPDRNKVSGYGCDDTLQSSATKATQPPAVLGPGAPNVWPSAHARSPLALERQAGQTVHTNVPAWRFTKKAPAETSISSNRAFSSIAEQYEQLFGRLPDPIRLHEEMGEFDGQVTFIGHPNRDVSAHQWSSSSFQWVNIGCYAHARHRVEGSLASDCLKGYEAADDPLIFFKLAAGNRERSTREAALSEEALTEVHQSANVDVISALLQSQHITSTLRSEGPSTSKLPLGTSTLPTLDTYKQVGPGETPTTISRDYLDDPFIAAPQPKAFTGSGHQSRSNTIDSEGDLNFSYEFPYKSTVQMPRVQQSGSSALHERSFGGSKKADAMHLQKDFLAIPPSQPNLCEVLPGEEAANSSFLLGERSFTLQKRPVLATPPLFNTNRRPPLGPYEGGDQYASVHAWNQPTQPVNQYYPEPNSFLLSHYAAPGFTVANPHHPVSTLNASAPIYTGIRGGGLGIGPVFPNRQGTGPSTSSAALQFSDPDAQRHTQDYEVVNGLSKQLPTPQNFQGPFFTDSKPTVNDPTASLSIEISEEDKLRNWFSDGHRAARQQEYAKILLNTTGLSTHGPNSTGVIGQRPSAREPTAIDNTSLFVRLHETLSEYAEESRSGKRDYWTRAWKSAPKEDRNANTNQHNKPSLR